MHLSIIDLFQEIITAVVKFMSRKLLAQSMNFLNSVNSTKAMIN